MAGSISQRDFAGRVGVSRQYVGRLCAHGKLPTLPDKSIPMPDGLRAFQALRGEGPPSEGGAAAEPPAPKVPTPTRVAVTYAADARLSTELRKAQLVERAHRARLLELDYDERRGLLVTTAEVQADARGCAEIIRDQLLSLAPRVASQLEALAAGPTGSPRASAIEALISDEVNLVIASVRSRFME